MRKKRNYYLFAFSVLLLLLYPSFAHADVGVPMIFLTLPAMIIALIPIIIIEAFIFTKMLKVDFKTAYLPSTVANAVSTIIGIPLSWALMLAFEILFDGGKAYGLLTIGKKVIAVTLQSAWLVPYEGDLWWMAPIAAAVGLIPSYFISVFIENWIVKTYFKDKDKKDIKKAVIKANLVTYGILLLVCAGILAYQFAVHKK
ncbi:MAG: hypothetical protein A2452_03650 [Candidatus Firestonebacteria bacterium RIFOXYC2_FULL_39_67]|nr:MAG: hypothetical protein A2536_00475 [Candidatus Firestonebacteria bacterium RIFOXYD2_FULL_39_29]OGF51931.1 MAG: hypothetical protein A2497_07610 [Candidatus Firestonebacteria bacterium RifOxyC12_full_39_7]OGF57097.1 MAG: hypothetical protein A2452_03650 [Candidatus Firestonebacteria bacterium RIFOXYC2_FULL_39_67]